MKKIAFLFFGWSIMIYGQQIADVNSICIINSMGKYLIFAALVSFAILTLYNMPTYSETDPFQEWKGQYKVSWPAEQEVYRRFIFQKNLALINRHNNDHTQTYKMGVNQFSIYTAQEFTTRFLASVPSKTKLQVKSDFKATGNIDWTTKGIISPVKNQGSCISGWAYSLTGVLQSLTLSNGQAISLSEQQLIDCTKKYGSKGCEGGFVESALVYVQLYGLSTTEQYPNIGKDQQCMTNGGGFRVDDFYFTSSIGCSVLVDLIQKSPVSLVLDASNWAFYKSGFFNNCGNNHNQAVLLVGMIDGNWKVKNSWGTSWGEKGFIRLASGNTCGICSTQILSANPIQSAQTQFQ